MSTYPPRPPDFVTVLEACGAYMASADETHWMGQVTVVITGAAAPA